jgi:ADP-ribosyl-[dinitrogen reductase] hydrolase
MDRARREAVLGCLLGGAIGDAFGGVAERGSLSLSDDTQLTLATCEAITESDGRVDPAAIAAVFERWFGRRRFSGLGSSTLKALRDLQAGSHWALAGTKGEMSAGNGGAMRIAPLAFAPGVDRTAVRDVVRITHHHDEAYLGALAVFVALRTPWPLSMDELLGVVIGELPDCRVRDQLVSARRLGPDASLDVVAAECGSSGWVVETLPLAFVAAWRMQAGSFAETLNELVRIGGDTDTIASIAGQMAGCRLGSSGLPSELLELLPQRELVDGIALGFCAALAGSK